MTRLKPSRFTASTCRSFVFSIFGESAEDMDMGVQQVFSGRAVGGPWAVGAPELYHFFILLCFQIFVKKDSSL